MRFGPFGQQSRHQIWLNQLKEVQLAQNKYKLFFYLQERKLTVVPTSPTEGLCPSVCVLLCPNISNWKSYISEDYDIK